MLTCYAEWKISETTHHWYATTLVTHVCIAWNNVFIANWWHRITYKRYPFHCGINLQWTEERSTNRGRNNLLGWATMHLAHPEIWLIDWLTQDQNSKSTSLILNRLFYIIATWHYKMHQNQLSAGAPPQTPLVKAYDAPQTFYSAEQGHPFRSRLPSLDAQIWPTQ